MKRKIQFNIQNQYTWVADIKVQHVLPNKLIQVVGPFVLLDHISSYKEQFEESHKKILGKCPHPYRGIATLTYIICGEVEHLDGMGNQVRLSSGCLHWMKAGKGILHDEAIRAESRMTGADVSVVRFWVNLPSKHKDEKPDYFSLLQNDIPKLMLANEAGWIKILIGKYDNVVAKVPCYLKQFLYHIHVEEGKAFSIKTSNELEYATFLLTNKIFINDTEFQAGEFIVFNLLGDLIELNNYGKAATDIILFGGEPYNESIVVEGTFVMNNPHEITQAYNDYYDGKYGDISIDKIKDK